MKWNGQINLISGLRSVPNAPEMADRKIFMVGPCTIFGGLVSDQQTIEYYLQERLHKAGKNNWKVVNLSVSGDMSWPRLFREKISSNDIVILMSRRFDVWRRVSAREKGSRIHCMESMREAWNGIDHPLDHVFNLAEHCSSQVMKNISNLIYKDIEQDVEKISPDLGSEAKRLQNYYISFDIYRYYKEYYAQPLMRRRRFQKDSDGVVGVIVLNANPFTKGHRYLIEEASKYVKWLYLLVVEENSSEYTTWQRYQMVKLGTHDMEHVEVLLSGDYVISNTTFAQYFSKESVNDIEDMSYDIHIFGKVVAKVLGATMRFVGEEPMDPITDAYNKTMKELLPKYGVDVVEIPRMRNESSDIISASKARSMLRNHDEGLDGYLTESIMKFLNSSG